MTDSTYLAVPDFCGYRTREVLVDMYQDSTNLYTRDSLEFWDNRLLSLRSVLFHFPFLGLEIKSLVRSAIERIREFYGVEAPLYPDVINLVGWRPGQSMPMHADNAYADGSPHALDYRLYSGLVYLNDDYEGGELRLVQGVKAEEIRPPAGTLISLPCGLTHIHGVAPVTTGIRVVLTFFLTTDAARCVPEYKDEVA